MKLPTTDYNAPGLQGLISVPLLQLARRTMNVERTFGG